MFPHAHPPPQRVWGVCHAYPAKDPNQHGIAFRDVVGQRRDGNTNVVGVMVESNLNAGNQTLGDDPSTLKYGVSITDACIAWDETDTLVSWAREELKTKQPVA